MFRNKKEPDDLDLLIDSAVRAVMKAGLGSEAYHQALDKVIKLYELKDRKTSKNSVDKTALAGIGAQLLGILMIIKHEQFHPIATKALSFIRFTKV